MPLGDLVISQSGIGDDWTDYRRELDLDTGIASTHFRAGGSDGRFSREVFISAPDQVAVIRYTSTNAGTIQLEIGLRSPSRHDTRSAEDGSLVLYGHAPTHIAENYRGDHPGRCSMKTGLAYGMKCGRWP